MKQIYQEPEIQVISMDILDIINSSTGGFDGDWIPLG